MNDTILFFFDALIYDNKKIRLIKNNKFHLLKNHK